METKVKRREWVKTAIIIFLVILLILTFFSNTIMNHSLPEVAAQYVESGSINARIRGTGTVSANETYDVTLNQTRKIRSVMVKVGDQVAAGDVLFTLEAMESDELEQAQDTLAQMELDYQKSLIAMSNSTSTEDRDVQKLQDAYNEALEAYHLYSNSDPSRIKSELEEAKFELLDYQEAVQYAQDELDEANEDYSDAQAEVTELEGEIAALESEINSNKTELQSLNEISVQWDEAVAAADRDWMIYGEAYERLQKYAGYGETKMAAYAQNTDLLKAAIESYTNSDISAEQKAADSTMDGMESLAEAYEVVTKNQAAIRELENNPFYDFDQIDREKEQLQEAIERSERELAQLEKDASRLPSLDALQSAIDVCERNLKYANRALDDQQALIDRYTQAASAAENLKAAEEALEDKVFQTNLGSTESLDLQHAKDAIDEQKALVEELTTNADGQEITANVSGVISEIHVTAGNTAGAQTPIATITVADRGYTVNIPVTNEQAKQVRIGDVANISNYYSGDLEATLENIANDPQNLGKGKMLIFRLTGDDVEAGANITLSIGQKSANYDCLVPNSAIRSDSNGSFVLVVVAKSSPLGNRYVATRADVQVLASDDTTSAVSGLANGDFVITTSTMPIEAGEQVRLVDNS